MVVLVHRQTCIVHWFSLEIVTRVGKCLGTPLNRARLTIFSSTRGVLFASLMNVPRRFKIAQLLGWFFVVLEKQFERWQSANKNSPACLPRGTTCPADCQHGHGCTRDWRNDRDTSIAPHRFHHATGPPRDPTRAQINFQMFTNSLCKKASATIANCHNQLSVAAVNAMFTKQLIGAGA